MGYKGVHAAAWRTGGAPKAGLPSWGRMEGAPTPGPPQQLACGHRGVRQEGCGALTGREP